MYRIVHNEIKRIQIRNILENKQLMHKMIQIHKLKKNYCPQNII